jgi:hypothetical protein
VVFEVSVFFLRKTQSRRLSRQDWACETPFPPAIMQTPEIRGSGMSGSAPLSTWTYDDLRADVPSRCTAPWCKGLYSRPSNQPRNGDTDPLFTIGYRHSECPYRPARRVAPETQLSPFCTSRLPSRGPSKQESQRSRVSRTTQMALWSSNRPYSARGAHGSDRRSETHKRE